MNCGGRVSKFRRSVIRQRPSRQSVIVSPSLRHRYFNRLSVIAKLQFVTAILEPSVNKTVYMGNSTQFRNSLGHFSQTTFHYESQQATDVI